MVNGWRRTANFKGLINYKKGDRVLVIEKIEGYWVITDEDGFSKASISTSKPEAMRKAMSYMRSH